MIYSKIYNKYTYCTNLVASERSLAMWVRGGFEVGIRSIPNEELWAHHVWIKLRRVWFGVRIRLLRCVSKSDCFVTGQVVVLHENNHLSMLSLS